MYTCISKFNVNQVQEEEECIFTLGSHINCFYGSSWKQEPVKKVGIKVFQVLFKQQLLPVK